MAHGLKPKIAVIGCGGTISTIAEHPLDFIEYPETGRKMETAEVVERMGDLAAFVELEPVRFRAVGSSAVGPTEWLELTRMIDAYPVARPDIDGVVILHGTATLEETAYFLNLALSTSLPVVLVGAQRPFNAASSDAQVNLISALRTVIDPKVAGCGVLVVLNDEIHQARDVTKTSTYRLNAFVSPGAGPIGVVDADRVTVNRRPVRANTRETPFRIEAEVATLPRVDIAYAYAGADAVAVRALIEAGAQGIVSAGFAPGMPTPGERAALEEAARSGVAVVQATRVGSGRVARRSYLRDRGWIAAGDLNPQKARILLMLALSVTRDVEAIQGFFDSY
ncbi:asparaginase [Microbaculum marinum]|uniref:Asparaginase n=1 Tax=Microbaculum marinum TaxID=1764581 RepID=A0AAW9R9Z3_9HYPH